MSEPTPPAPVPNPPPGGNMAGCALFAIGGLLVVPSGLCTAFGGVGLIMQLFTDPDELVRDFSDYFPFVLITLIPLALGIALIYAGLRTRRNP